MLRRSILWAPALCLLAACSQTADNVDSSESQMLPNSNIFDVDHDGTTYKKIANYFASNGHDMSVRLDTFEPSWPLADASPAVLNRFGTPVLFAEYGYYHTGFDVVRSDPALAADVLAPHDGLAVMFDWSGERVSEVGNPYTMAVAIYDPVSHLVTEILHVEPSAAIAQATDPLPVKKGDVIGQLAKAPIEGARAAQIAHAQIVIVDGQNQKLLNPATLFTAYEDTVAPTARSVYVADEDAATLLEFSSGKIDVLVEAFDRDDHSNRNLEVSAIAYTIKDQAGNVLGTQPRCSLDNLYESIAEPASFRAKELIDFGSAVSQVGGGWNGSDVDNPNRTFRYALTQLAVVDGRCTVLDDAAGFVTVGDAVTQLEVSVTLWDANGNESERVFELGRAPAPAPADDVKP